MVYGSDQLVWGPVVLVEDHKVSVPVLHELPQRLGGREGSEVVQHKQHWSVLSHRQVFKVRANSL